MSSIVRHNPAPTAQNVIPIPNNVCKSSHVQTVHVGVMEIVRERKRSVSRTNVSIQRFHRDVDVIFKRHRWDTVVYGCCSCCSLGFDLSDTAVTDPPPNPALLSSCTQLSQSIHAHHIGDSSTQDMMALSLTITYCYGKGARQCKHTRRSSPSRSWVHSR